MQPGLLRLPLKGLIFYKVFNTDKRRFFFFDKHVNGKYFLLNFCVFYVCVDNLKALSCPLLLTILTRSSGSRRLAVFAQMK